MILFVRNVSGAYILGVSLLGCSMNPTPASAPAAITVNTSETNYNVSGEGDMDNPIPSAQALITSFHQGATGNCASIGVIKAAMHEYGVDGVFSSRGVANGGISYKLRNGEEIVVSDEELKKSAQLSRFVLADEQQKHMFDRANEMFAVMTKYLQKQRKKNFEASANDLNDGEYFAETPSYLGLEDDVELLGGGVVRRYLTKMKFIRRHNSCVAASAGHAWFVSHGFADDHGKIVKFNSVIPSLYKIKATHVYCFSK